MTLCLGFYLCKVRYASTVVLTDSKKKKKSRLEETSRSHVVLVTPHVVTVGYLVARVVEI